MTTHLLVPLDGSRLAKAALPATDALARALGAAVTLLHIVERAPPRAIHGDPHLTDAGEARAYLEEIARRDFAHLPSVACHVHQDDPCSVVRGIVTHAAELDASYVVMCTHGRGGLGRLLFGSIAQQVVACGTTPVLLIAPASDGTAGPFDCRRVLVPLDGQTDHEVGLTAARALCAAFGAAIHLIMVVPTRETLSGAQAATGQLMPLATSAVLELACQDAEEYLGAHVARLGGHGLAVTSEVARGSPAEAIHEATARTRADLVVVASHGRAGLDALYSGSVAPAISAKPPAPLLVVPVGGRAGTGRDDVR